MKAAGIPHLHVPKFYVSTINEEPSPKPGSLYGAKSAMAELPRMIEEEDWDKVVKKIDESPSGSVQKEHLKSIVQKQAPLRVIRAISINNPSVLRERDNETESFPLHLVSHFGAHFDAVKYLVDSYEEQLDKKDLAGDTPLDIILTTKWKNYDEQQKAMHYLKEKMKPENFQNSKND